MSHRANVDYDVETTYIYPAHLLSPVVFPRFADSASPNACPSPSSASDGRVSFAQPSPKSPASKPHRSPSVPDTITVRTHVSATVADTTDTNATNTATHYEQPTPPNLPSWWLDVKTATVVLMLALFIIIISVIFTRRA